MHPLVIGVAALRVTSYLTYVLVVILYRSLNPPLRNIPWPKPLSWQYGNIPELVSMKN
uniref:Putative cytochrome P450 n=1 Tax=Moniliophthora roreri TaxID=221103 RepID=A0A0W0G3U1_MONRR